MEVGELFCSKHMEKRITTSWGVGPLQNEQSIYSAWRRNTNHVGTKESPLRVKDNQVWMVALRDKHDLNGLNSMEFINVRVKNSIISVL